MKKKNIILVLTVLLLVIISIVTVIILRNNSRNRLLNVYEKMIQKDEYQFERSTKNEENKIIVAEKKDQKIIDMYNFDNHTTTLIKGDLSYLILHEKEEYYNYIISEENPLVDELKKISKEEYNTGKEEVNGKKYYYEEYDQTSYFLLYSSKDMDSDTVKTRFYFQGSNLVYIKTIYQTTDNQTEEELWKVNVKYEVEDSIFEIPQNYAESLL